MKKSQNRFSTQNLADRLTGETSSPMAKTPEKSTPIVNSPGQTPNKISATVNTPAQTPNKTTPPVTKITVKDTTKQNQSPTVNAAAQTPNKTTSNVNSPIGTPNKPTPTTTPMSTTPGKISPLVNVPQPTPAKIGITIEPTTPQEPATTGPPNINSFPPTPEKPHIEATIPEPTPEKPHVEGNVLAPTPEKPHVEGNLLAPTPEKPHIEATIPEPTPEKPHFEGTISAPTPEKPTAKIGSLETTPIKTPAEISSPGQTPEKPSAEVNILGQTPEKQSAEISSLGQTPEKKSAEVNILGQTPEKPSAETSALEQTPEKQSAEISSLGQTPEKTTSELGTMVPTEKTTQEPNSLEETPEKTTSELGTTVPTEKTTQEPNSLEPTPEKTTSELGIMVPTDKTTPDVVALEPTPEKPHIEGIVPEPTPEKPHIEGTVLPHVEHPHPDTTPMEPTPEKPHIEGIAPEPTPEKPHIEGIELPHVEHPHPDVVPMEPTPEKPHLEGVELPHVEHPHPDIVPMEPTPEKPHIEGIDLPHVEHPHPELGVHDGFANIDSTGFIVGKNAGQGLLTDFVGISGLPTSGQYDHTGNQGLGLLAVRDGIANIDADGFTPNKQHLQESDFLGISGDPGSMKYTIPDGPSPLATYRYNKDMYSKITGEPQTYLTPGGFMITGKGAKGNITEDGISLSRNANSSGNNSMIDQYNKFDLRDEAFHRFDGFTSGLGQPYINSKVLANDATKKRRFRGQDGLVRGGIVSRVIRTVNDTLRIGKFLISPTGLLFIAKNIGMQLTNPKVETFAGIDEGGFFARTTRIYPLGLSTLAQVVANVAPMGTLGLLRHGMGFLEGEKNYYENVVSEVGRFEIKREAAAPIGNRLVKLSSEMQVGLGNETNMVADYKNVLGAALGGVGGALTFATSKLKGAAKDKLGQLSGFIPKSLYGAEISLLSGWGGPNSLYGLFNTTIRRSTSGIPIEQHSEANGTWADSKIVITNYDKGPGTILAAADEAHQGLKTNPNNTQLTFTPDRPYSDVVDASSAEYSIHTSDDGESAGLDIDDLKTPENWDNQIFGNVHTSEEPYSQTARQGSDDAPAGLNNRDKIAGAASRFSTNNLDAIDDPRADNLKRDVLEGSPMAQILDVHGESNSGAFVTPAGDIKHSDESGMKMEGHVWSHVPTDDTDKYGPTVGNLASYETYAYGDIPVDQLAHNKIMDFRSDLKNNNKSFQEDGDEYAKDPRGTGFGQHYGTRNLDRSDRTITLKDSAKAEIGDKIVIKAIKKGEHTKMDWSTRSTTHASAEDDFVKLVIAGIQFRAYIKSFSHNIKPQFQDVEYVGRLTDVKLMSKFNVDFSLDFSVAALTARELEGMYYKLNALAQKSAPSYSDNKPQGPLNKITIGDYFKDAYCFLNNIGYTMNEQSPWDIDPGRQLPYYIDVTVSGDMITSVNGNLLSAGSDFFSATYTDYKKNKTTIWKEGASSRAE